MSHRILLIEEDPTIAGQLVNGLQRAGFRVLVSPGGREAYERAIAGGYDALLLDAVLSVEDSFTILAAVRRRFTTPIVILSARDNLAERLRAFEMGVDDYLCQPFYLEELIARVRARLRPRPLYPRAGIRFGDVEVDLDEKRAFRAGEDVGLTPLEFQLLSWLVQRPGRPITRRQLIEDAIDGDGPVQERTIDSHIAHIRRKLGPEAGRQVKTVFRIGYRFDPVR